MSTLLSSVNIGGLQLKNKFVMAPLTRCRASGNDGRTPNDLMKTYYSQRATAGLILTEATSISPMGVGYPHTPGIWSNEHVEGWKPIVSAVQALGSKMICQLWHVGRISDALYLNGEQPVAPSAIAAEGHVSMVRPVKPFPTPRALQISEIASTVQDYKKAAQNALAAGFDGVEIHAANGYLPDQFLNDNSNKRTDQYGGSIENRTRFLMEIVDAVTEVWPADKVGVHLSPRGLSHSMADSNPEALYSVVAEQLGQRKIGFIFVREIQGPGSLAATIKRKFGGSCIANDQFDFQSAEKVVADGTADAVSFGQLYIANPDLVLRYEKKAPLNPLVKETIYAAGETGYTDYPFLKDL